MVHERRTKFLHDPVSNSDSDEIEVVPPPKRKRKPTPKISMSRAGQMGGPSHAAPRRSYQRAAQPQGDVPQEEVPIFDEYPPLQPYRKYIMHRPEYTRINFGDPGVKRVDYTTKQRGAAFKERKENPYDYEKYITDRRFWSKFQADWYISVFIEKKNAITVSKYINWDEMSEKNNPTFDLVIRECERKHLYEFLALNQDWNNELVAQFCSTAWFEGEGKNSFIHFNLQGRAFWVSYKQFATILKLDDTLDEMEIHDDINPTDEALMTLYRDEDPDIATTHGLRPYMEIMNRIFRETLTPKRGDRTKIHGTVKNLLLAMDFDHPPFSVFHFFWTELRYMLHHGSNPVIYAPYIQRMINAVTGMEFGYDAVHAPYCPQPPKEQEFPPEGESPPSAHSPPQPTMDMPSTSAMPSSSRTRPRRKGNAFISGLKALFKVCRNTNDVVRAHARANQQSINRIERHLGIEETDWPAFPPSPPRDFPAAWEHYEVGDDDGDDDDEDDE
jgi:hypothetical protein